MKPISRKPGNKHHKQKLIIRTYGKQEHGRRAYYRTSKSSNHQKQEGTESSTPTTYTRMTSTFILKDQNSKYPIFILPPKKNTCATISTNNARAYNTHVPIKVKKFVNTHTHTHMYMYVCTYNSPYSIPTIKTPYTYMRITGFL